MPGRGFRTYLLSGFAATALIFILLGVYAVYSFYQIQAGLAREQKTVDDILITISNIESSYANQNLAWSNILVYGKNPKKYHDYLQSFYESERQTLREAEKLKQLLSEIPNLNSKSSVFLKKLYGLKRDYRKALGIYNASVDSSYSIEEFLSVINSEPSALLAYIHAGIQDYHSKKTSELERVANKNEVTLITLTIVSVGLLLAGLVWFLDKNFARPMSRSIATARQVAGGDHSQRIDVFALGEFGELARTFNQMLDHLERSNHELTTTVAKLEDQVEQRKLAENLLLEERRQLAASNKELESFSYSVSHDLRSPLRSIAGFSKILEEDYERMLDETGKNYLDRIRTAANRMGEIIDDLLELSQVNRKPLNLSAVSLSNMAEEIISEFKDLDNHRNVEIKIAPGLETSADKNLARIVLVNLLGNAWKYTSMVDNATIEFGETNLDGNRIFFVQDNGAGFDMEFADNLFQPFHRLHQEQEFDGTGIGLAIVDRILHRHGGFIRGESKPGEGARFTFSFG